MDTSAMDMTAVCSSVNGTKSELSSSKDRCELLLQENYELKNKIELLEKSNKDLENEIVNVNTRGGKTDLDLSVSLDVTSSKAIFQENHELKKRIDILEKVNMELESDINYLTHKQAKETTRLINIKEELGIANSKIKRLESSLEEEQIQCQRLIQEAKETKVTKPETSVKVLPDLEQLNALALQIEKLELLREEDQHSAKELTDEKDDLIQKLSVMNDENQALLRELSEVKEHLNQKSIDLQNVNIAFEGLREEKLLLDTEIQLLKASDSNAPRGNSLFGEVEDNRKKAVAQRELLKMKYINLKKIYNQKQAENNKLKMEIVKIRREEKEDEKGVHHDYNNLIETYKKRVKELEERVKILEQKSEQPPISADPDNSQWMWVNTMVESARMETKSLQEQLDRRGLNYVTQGHQLFTSQKENRKLKAIVSKLQSDIDELKMQLDTIKSAKENDQDQDGISPPATDVAIEYQREKRVRFKEALSEHTRNVKKTNTSSSGLDSSVGQQNKPLGKTNVSLIEVKDENKENLES